MAEVANYSGALTNSDDTYDWNWTRPAVNTDHPLSSGLRASVIFALSILILAGIMLNLVTVVTHLQIIAASNRNGPQRITSYPQRVRCGLLQTICCGDIARPYGSNCRCIFIIVL